MRVFLITIVVSTVLSVALWNFRLAHRISPEHPLLVTTVVAMVLAIAVQTLLTRDEKADKSK